MVDEDGGQEEDLFSFHIFEWLRNKVWLFCWLKHASNGDSGGNDDGDGTNEDEGGEGMTYRVFRKKYMVIERKW